jgi:NAD(P)-dependent dehydrogenase (short-subunit alcohol dehydrogenase family)
MAPVAFAAMRGLEGKRVVVTGGARGIGAATVERFRAEGSLVTVFDLEPGDAGVGVDVSDGAAVRAAFADLGPVDVVVSNAGVSERGPALEIDERRWRRVLDTNLLGVFNVAQAAGGAMLEAGGGVILNTASTNGYVGHPFYADYNASKAGVIELTRTLALEWAPTVRVNAVCPGYVLTPMQKAEYTPEMLAQVDAKIPLRRHAQPDEIAAVYAFLASDDAAYITGAAITVDGGETAGGLASR